MNQPEHQRRTLLRGALVAGGAVAATCSLSACAGGGSATRDSAGGVAQVPPGTQIGPTAKVPIGGATIFADAKVVVSQPVAGEFTAYSAVCPHQGCLVSSVADATITCRCHGSEFKLADGSVIQGPAATGLAEQKVVDDGGTLRFA